MTRIRKHYNDQFKFKVELDATKGLPIINKVASRFQVHPKQILNWKKQLPDDDPIVFVRKTGKHHQTESTQEAELYDQIGRLKMELEWLKKSCLKQLRLNAR